MEFCLQIRKKKRREAWKRSAGKFQSNERLQNLLVSGSVGQEHTENSIFTVSTLINPLNQKPGTVQTIFCAAVSIVLGITDSLKSK